MRITLLSVAIVAVGFVSAASAQTLVNDVFNRTTNPGNWGSTGGIPYILGNATQTPFVDGSVGNFGGGSALTVGANLAPLAPLGYTVGFSANRGVSSGGFISFFTGVGDATTGGLVFDIENSGADYGVLVQQNNDVSGELIARIFTNGTEASAFALSGSDNSAAFDVFFEVLAPDGYDDGDLGTLNLSVNGSFLGSETLTFDGVNSGFATIASNIGGDNATFDNFVVTAIPEPSSMAALSVLGLIGATRIRRRREVA